MSEEFLILSLAVFGASTLQAATGIGFGVVAGPILLAMLNSGAAIQISILMNLLIALALAPSLRAEVDWKLLKWLAIGTLIGMPLGLAVFLSISIFKLKIIAALAVLLALGFVLRNMFFGRNGAGGKAPRAAPSLSQTLPVAAISGLMGGALAMPGPVPAGWMSAIGYGKARVRATMLMLFVFSYSAALLLQILLAGISRDTFWTSFQLVPAAIAGILIGKALSGLISERVFSWLVVATLVLTAGLLFVSVA